MRTISLISSIALAAIATFATGCTETTTEPPLGHSAPLEKVMRGGMIWADGELFRTIGTPATFSGQHGNYDELYVTGGNGTFADGVTAISEAKPGDRDYNGGRWHVNTLKEGVDPMKYADADSVDDLDPSDFESTTTYFECPLLPSRGN
jgi:hypothetical protein